MRLEELTCFELEKLKKIGVVILGISPIEQHGKHLPIGTDYYLVEKWIDGTINVLESQGEYPVLKLPIIPFGCSDVKVLSGNLYLKQKQIYQLVYEILLNISSWGIQNIIIISGHADPRHLIAIEEACGKVNRRFGKVAFSPMGAIFSGKEVGIEIQQSKEVDAKFKDFPNDYHAGWIETSLMLFYAKQLVKKSYKDCEETVVLEKDMIIPKRVMKKIANVGHMGNPKQANENLGKDLHESMVYDIVKASKSFIERQGYEQYEHHFLYRFPFMRVNKMRRY
jgi:creatinine amidohydrolase